MAKTVIPAPKKRHFLFNPLKRPLPYVGIIIAVIIIIFQGTIRRYTANLVGDWLISNLKESTEGKYTLEYDFVRFDIFTKELRIQNLNLTLDTTIINKDVYLEENSNLVDLSTPVVILKLRSLWDLILNDKLLIAYVGMQEPRVKLIRSESLSEEEVEVKQEVATEKVRTYLREMAIDSFRIIDGALQVGLQNAQKQELIDFSVRNFSILLKGFKLDEKNPRKLFRGIYAKDLELNIKNQKLTIPQLHHEIQFKKLRVSTTDSIIRFDTLQIIPLTSADSSYNTKLFLKNLSLSRIDFRKAYDDYEIDIGKMLIDAPKWVFTNKGENISTTKKVKALNSPFQQMVIGEIELKNGDIDLNLDRKMSSKKLNAVIRNYHIDTSQLSLKSLTNNIKNLQLSATNNMIELNDSIHQAEIGHLRVSTQDSMVLINQLKISPIATRRKYKLYKQRGTRFVNYSTIKQLYLGGININQIINQHQLLADSALLVSPNIRITEYPYITQNTLAKTAFPFLIKSVFMSQGNVYYNKRFSGKNHKTQLNGISLTLNNLYPGLANRVNFDSVDFSIREGFSEIKSIGHTLRFKKLVSNNLKNIDIESLTLAPDSVTLPYGKLDIKANEIRLRGLDHHLVNTTGTVIIDEFLAAKIGFNADLKNKLLKSKNSNLLQHIVINNFELKRGDFEVIDKASQFSIENVEAFSDSLNLHLAKNSDLNPVTFKNFILKHDQLNYKNKLKTLSLSARSGSYSQLDSLLKFDDLSFVSGKNIKGIVGLVSLKGLEQSELLSNKGLHFNYLLLNKSSVNINGEISNGSGLVFNNDNLKHQFLSQLSYINFDSIKYQNADIIINSKKRTSTIHNLNSIIRYYNLDTTTAAINVLQPKQINLTSSLITTQSKSDTISIQDINLDLARNTLLTGSINLAVVKGGSVLKASIPNFYANGFNTTNLLNQNFSLDTIRFSNAKVNLQTQDSSKNQEEPKFKKELEKAIKIAFGRDKNNRITTLSDSTINKVFDVMAFKDDTTKRSAGLRNLLKLNKFKEDRDVAANKSIQPDSVTINERNAKRRPINKAFSVQSQTNGEINYIGINNATFHWIKNGFSHHYLNGLKFSVKVDTLILDTLNSFNINKHIKNLTVKVKDYRLYFDDSLNNLSFDEMRFSSEKDAVYIHNLSLTPQVNKYEYAKIKGHQVSWQQIQGLDIDIKSPDFVKLLTNQGLWVKKITTKNGQLNIFKDKSLPIPVNQYRPMPQAALKELKFPILVDSVEVKNLDIAFSSRLLDSNPEGTITFKHINAFATNVVNIDSLVFTNPYILVHANTKIMGKGNLTANFNFDMGDENNSFIYNAHLGSMNAAEFNSILNALAFVSVESGKIKDLSLEAKGDSYYATGKMRFQYNDLKVSTINKKNLKTKGMGKVIKTFFANAFVVKKNNPALKLFPREGDMYYERDPQKIIIDYVTKTALSGVVSSIGARNIRKDIKRIQRESKKQKDEERKALKKAGKNKKIPN